MNWPHRKIGRLSLASRRALQVAFYFFLASGVFALSYAGYVVAESRVYQDLQLRALRQAGPLSEPHTLAEGDVLGEMDVPRIGLHAIVLHGDSRGQLRHAVGHLAKSAMPGEQGNVVLAAHRDTFFRPLQNIRVGDEIRFTTRNRRFEYRVQSIEVVEPAEIRVLQPSKGHDLTLLTCFPFRYVGPAPQRFVVHAREIDEGAFPVATSPVVEWEGTVLK